MTNPVDVLRDALSASYSADRRDFGEEFAEMLGNKRLAALADVERLVEAARGVAEAPYQDAKMGYPLPGDSCTYIAIALGLDETLARFPKPEGEA